MSLALVLGFALTLLAAGQAQAQATAPRRLPGNDLPNAAALEVTDETGRRVSVPQAVRRIISLAPSLTETVYALGAQERLVGVTDYCDYPPEAQAKPKVGGTINPNLEQVVALKPDLVLATRALNRHETVEALDRLGIAAYASDPRSVEGVLASTARLAEVIGARERGEALVADLRTRLTALKRRLGSRPARRVLFVVWWEPLISIGRETFLADALRWAGAESVVDTTQDWPRLALEEVVRLQPEYLVFASSHSETVERDFETLRDRPGWRNLEAVRQRHLAVVSDAVNRPSPRLVEAIEQLARQLHPDAFESKPENHSSGPGMKGETRPRQEFGSAKREEACPCAR
ncbi:MAG: cobalamin-binding protein [Acidobacteria bacterium]|nr:cobalamin-binding protein [Acidobacteriota bacterium]